MLLIDLILAIGLLPVFAGVFIATLKPISDIFQERQKKEYILNQDMFLSKSFLSWCENFEKEVGEKDLKKWEEDMKKLYPNENIKVQQLFFDNPLYVRATWNSGETEREVIGQIKCSK